jgi:serine-type D-Ala-D-Ala carboxypeptidase/endopeptidase (penicillin-binding protein 4)
MNDHNSHRIALMAGVRNAALVVTCLGLAACVSAPKPLNSAEQTSGRWGIYAVDEAGRVVRAERENERFMPASTAKLFVTAAAFQYLGDVTISDPLLATEVHLAARGEGEPPDLVLRGGGDPGLGAGPDCIATCLEQLADAVAASGLAETINHVIGDASLYTDEPFGEGWGWQDLQWYYGAPVSALSVNSNEVAFVVTPGSEAGAPVQATFAPGDAVFGVENRAVTLSADARAELRIRRMPGEANVVVSGSLPLGSPPRPFRLAIDDPASAAAARFAGLLAERGITIEGEVRTAEYGAPSPVPAGAAPIASLPAAPLLSSLRAINLDSNNHAAEMLLLRIARARGGNSAAEGLAAVMEMAALAGISADEAELTDASGLSTYNRVTPRGLVKLLSWSRAQDWGPAWRNTLPVGAETGTLKRRFSVPELAGRVQAKTGTLRGANALAGYIETEDGEIAFAILANDRPAKAASLIADMDAVVAGLAADR